MYYENNKKYESNFIPLIPLVIGIATATIAIAKGLNVNKGGREKAKIAKVSAINQAQLQEIENKLQTIETLKQIEIQKQQNALEKQKKDKTIIIISSIIFMLAMIFIKNKK